MSLGPKVYSNNPIVNGRTEVFRLAASGAANPALWTAIDTATTTELANVTGVLISANATDVYLTSGAAYAAGTGIKIVQNTNLFLPLHSATGLLTYEGTPDIMLFFD
jgi:hypothetical protein